MNRNGSHTRSFTGTLETRSESDNEMVIEGYFAVFNQITELFPGGFEQIAPEAFNNTLGNDIRALINHDTSLVLGRNKANTLDLKVDSHGLYGRIKVNPNDVDAMNLYERVKRGDVDQCSFGFTIRAEDVEWRDDGTVLWTLRDVELFEISVCTFPAYEETGVQARNNEITQHYKKALELRKNKLKERLNNGIKSVND